jgi:hypothetical protein
VQVAVVELAGAFQIVGQRDDVHGDPALARAEMSASARSAVAKVRSICDGVIQTFRDDLATINSNAQLSAEGKAVQIGARVLNAMTGLQGAEVIVGAVGMEVRANDEAPLPPAKGTPDDLREIRAAIRDLPANEVAARYRIAMLDGDATFVQAVETANATAFPNLRISESLRQEALAAREAAGTDEAARLARDLRGIRQSLVAIVNDAKRALGVDPTQLAAAGMDSAGGYVSRATKANGAGAAA